MKLVNSFKDLNKKYPSIKFDYKASKNWIVFLDIEIYLHNGKLHTKIYRKETDRRHYPHIKSELPKSLKDSLLYHQAIRINQISSNLIDLNNSRLKMKSSFVKQRSHSSLINWHLERINQLNKTDHIKEKDTRHKSDRILLVLSDITKYCQNHKEKLEYLTDKQKL